MMKEYHEITVGDCGCNIQQTTNGILTATYMNYCPRHAAADEMYDALNKAEKALDALSPKWPDFGTMVDGHKAIKAALALADSD